MVPQHRSGAPVAELGDDFRESTKEAIDRARGHSGFSREPTYCERLGAAAPNDSTCDLEQLLPCFVIVFAWSTHARQSIATVLRYGDTKRSGCCAQLSSVELIMSVDVIVVGSRVAGAATGMLLARAGLRVLVVDQAHFPSDTLSTHQIQVPGVARLARFGLLQPLLDAGTPPTPHVRFQAGGAVVEGEFPAYQGVNMMISPRRTVLDALLVDAARAAGAEVREGCSLVNLVKDRDRVSGVHLQDRRSGRLMTESAALVIGADGKHSKVAQLAGAAERRRVAARTFAFYGYWDGLPVKGGEIYSGTGFAASAWPTNDGLTMTYVAGPIANFEAIRRDPTAHLIARSRQGRQPG